MNRRSILIVLFLVTCVGILHIWFEQFLWGIKAGVYRTDQQIGAELRRLQEEGVLAKSENESLVQGRLIHASMRASRRAMPDETELLILMGSSLTATVVLLWPSAKQRPDTVVA